MADINYYTPRKQSLGGYIGITLSVRPSVCLSVRLSVHTFLLAQLLLNRLTDFDETLHKGRT